MSKKWYVVHTYSGYENKGADSEKEKDGKGGEDKAAADTRDGAAEEKDDAKATAKVVRHK